MNRLRAELHRLFAAQAADNPSADHPTLHLTDNAGRVRALVLGLRRPADWSVLGRVWQAVQQDFGWPAPAIAISGDDSLQLWFSLAIPVPTREAHDLLALLVQRYLADVGAQRLTLWPAADGTHTAPVPAQVLPDQWSAFVAPDLAPVFADSPWLDISPGDEGQADLLRSLSCIRAADWQAAWQRLYLPASSGGAAGVSASDGSAPAGAGSSAGSAASPAWGASGAPAASPTPGPSWAEPLRPTTANASATSAPSDAAAPAESPADAPLDRPAPAAQRTFTDPRDFLLDVMNDPAVPLEQRIDAAKALLLADPR